jgi:hypothetical protein
MPHVMFADSRHEPFGDNHARTQTLGDGDRDVANAAPVVFHGQMLEMLLDRGNGNETGLQFAGLHPLAKFATRQFAQQNFSQN